MTIDVSITGAPDSNENEFPGDDTYMHLRDALENAVREIWDAGAPVEDIEAAVETALEDSVE